VSEPQANSGFVPVSGGRIYYEVDGKGPPVLLIHGGLGSLRMWDEQVPAFAEHYRVVRYDTRGFGRTETDDVPFSNRADAAAVLAHVGVASCHLIGQSRGGSIALDFTIERPDLVRSLVSVAGNASGSGSELPESVEPPPWDEMERLWEAKAWDALAELETRVWVDGWGQPADRVDRGLRRQVHDWILENYRAEKAEGQPQPLDPPAVGRLDEVNVPLLVITGTADDPASLANSRQLARSVRDARLEEFEGVAHMVQLEDPERFNRLVLGFLGSVNGSS
jgi:3-oxoadipate enol-lactonase